MNNGCLLLCHSYIFSSARCDIMPGSHAQDNKPTPITENYLVIVLFIDVVLKTGCKYYQFACLEFNLIKEYLLFSQRVDHVYTRPLCGRPCVSPM